MEVLPPDVYVQDDDAEKDAPAWKTAGLDQDFILVLAQMHNLGTGQAQSFDSDSFLQKFWWGKGTFSNFLAMLFFYLHKWCSRREGSDQLRSYCNPPFEVAWPTWWSENRIMMMVVLMMAMMIIVRQYTSEMRIVAKAMMVLGLLW